MNTSSRNALKAYSTVSIETGVLSATPQKLVVMLYDGALTAIAMAQHHLERKETAQKGASISKAISIIEDGLRASLDLDVGGELAVRLHELYQYMAHRLLQANLHNDGGALDEVCQLLTQLRSAWEVLAAKPDTANDVPNTPPPVRATSTTYGRV